MKNLLLTSALFFIIFSGFAQPGPIVLTVNDVANSGDFVVNTNIPFAGDAPSTGTNQTYDFSAVGYSALKDTTFYIPAEGTPFASSMSGANICQQGPGSFTYFLRNNSGFYLKGFVFQIPSDSSFIQLPSEFVFAFSPQIPIVTFPATLGMNLTTSSTSSRVEIPFDTVVSVNGVTLNIKKIGVSLNVKDTSKIDGWGSATFPAPGSSFNVLRNTHNMALETKLELFVLFFGIDTWIPMPASLIPAGLGDFLGGNINDVMLWTNGWKQPLVTMSLDTNGVVSSAEFQSDLLVEPTSTLVSIKPSFEFYPNPAAEAVQFQLPANTHRVLVRDVTGKLVKEQEISGNHASLPVSDLSNGIYSMEVMLLSGNPLRKKLVVRH